MWIHGSGGWQWNGQCTLFTGERREGSREGSHIHCTGMEGYFRAHVFNVYAVLEASQKMSMRAHFEHKTGAQIHERDAGERTGR